MNDQLECALVRADSERPPLAPSAAETARARTRASLRHRRRIVTVAALAASTACLMCLLMGNAFDSSFGRRRASSEGRATPASVLMTSLTRLETNMRGLLQELRSKTHRAGRPDLPLEGRHALRYQLALARARTLPGFAQAASSRATPHSENDIPNLDVPNLDVPSQKDSNHDIR